MKFIRAVEREEALTYYSTPFASSSLHEVTVEECRSFLMAAKLLSPYPAAEDPRSMVALLVANASFPKPIVLMAVAGQQPQLLDGRHRTRAAVALHDAGRLPAGARLLAMVGVGQLPSATP